MRKSTGILFLILTLATGAFLSSSAQASGTTTTTDTKVLTSILTQVFSTSTTSAGSDVMGTDPQMRKSVTDTQIRMGTDPQMINLYPGSTRMGTDPQM